MSQYRVLILSIAIVGMTLAPAAGASARVHGITPLNTLANECGVTDTTTTGARAAQGEPITSTSGIIPAAVGQSHLSGGDGGRNAPVGCAS